MTITFKMPMIKRVFIIKISWYKFIDLINYNFKKVVLKIKIKAKKTQKLTHQIKKETRPKMLIIPYLNQKKRMKISKEIIQTLNIKRWQTIYRINIYLDQIAEITIQ